MRETNPGFDQGHRLRPILLIAALLSVLYLVFIYAVPAPQVNRIGIEERKGQPVVVGLYLTKVDPGALTITFSAEISRIELYSISGTPLPTPRRLTHTRYEIRTRSMAFIHYMVAVLAHPPTSPDLKMKLTWKPAFDFWLLIFQFALLTLLIALVLHFARLLFGLLLGNSTLTGQMGRLCSLLVLALFTLFFVYFFSHLRSFTGDLMSFHPRPWMLLGTNLILAAGAALLFLLAIEKSMSRLPLLPIAASVVYLAVPVHFSIQACGDATIWKIFLQNPKVLTSLAEIFSLLLNQLLKRTAHLAGLALSPEQVLTWSAKLIGVLFAFSLYLLCRSLHSLSDRQQKALFLIACLFPISAYMLGFPEFAFYALPALLLSLFFAATYIQQKKGGDLLLSFLFYSIGCLFHASLLFSLPAYFLLPLLADRSTEGLGSRLMHLTRRALPLLLSAVGITAVIFLLLRLLSIQAFVTNAMGGDARKFIEFLPHVTVFQDPIFLFSDYFWLRSLIVVLAFPLPLVLLGSKIYRTAAMEAEDIFLLLIGLSQLVLFFFWGFDRGISDFDLYSTPLFALELLLAKQVVSRREKSSSLVWVIALFSLLSTAGLIAWMASR